MSAEPRPSAAIGRLQSGDRVECEDRGGPTAEIVHLRLELARATPRLHRLAGHYALLGGETRLKILALLEGAGELCVCDLARVLQMTPAAVSQHLGRLKGGGLVAARRAGMTIYYRCTELAGCPPSCSELGIDG